MARQIDARGIWQGKARALDQFAQAWAIDCGACDETFRRIYGWNQDCIDKALFMAGDESRAPGGRGMAPLIGYGDS
jgi:hypothetical protein